MGSYFNRVKPNGLKFVMSAACFMLWAQALSAAPFQIQKIPDLSMPVSTFIAPAKNTTGLTIRLGRILCEDRAYLNGRLIGETARGTHRLPPYNKIRNLKSTMTLSVPARPTPSCCA